MIDEIKPEELFKKYFVVGEILKGVVVVYIRIDRLDDATLTAYGTVVDDDGDGFDNNEPVTFEHLGNEVWRVTSEANDHGHPVYLGEEWSGVSIGS